MSEQRLSKLQKWILKNCYTCDVYKGIYKEEYIQKKKKEYTIERIYIFKYFGFKLYWKHYRWCDWFRFSHKNLEVFKEYNHPMSYFGFLRDNDYYDIIEKEPDKEKEIERLFEKKRKDEQKKHDSASVTITRSIENLFSKGYIDVHSTHGEWLKEHLVKTLNSNINTLNNMKKRIEEPHQSLIGITIDESYMEDLVKQKKEHLEKGYMWKTWCYKENIDKIRLTQKGLEKAKELLGGDLNN